MREWVSAVDGKRVTELAYLRAYTPLRMGHTRKILSLIHKFRQQIA
jgi:hypothetical protein